MVLVDNPNKIYIVCDGVTRSMIDGQYPIPSPSAEVSQLFAKTACNVLRECLSKLHPESAINEAIVQANKAVEKYNQEKFSEIDYLENDFGGTVAIVSVAINDVFHYAYLGDCLGISIIGEDILFLTKPQTSNVASYREKFGFARETTLEVRQVFRNNKHHPMGYGVFTGERNALGFVEHGSIRLKTGQKIILASDGVSHLVDKSPRFLLNASPEAIIKEAEKLEMELKIRSDDKSVIAITVS